MKSQIAAYRKLQTPNRNVSFLYFSACFANDADPVVRLRVGAQTISVGQFHIQARKTLGIGLQETVLALVGGESSLTMPNLPTCLWQKSKNQFQVPTFWVNKNRSVLFCLRLKIAAFSRFQNRSVFGTLRFTMTQNCCNFCRT